MRKTVTAQRLFIAAWLLPAMLVAGCGNDSNLGGVAGEVTLNGKPLAGALVTFQPQRGGSPSAATTDARGRYRLRYTREQEGAELGEHAVSISTFSAGDPDGDPPSPPVPERVPPKYNARTQLTAAVNPGGNTVDFALETVELATRARRVSR